MRGPLHLELHACHVSFSFPFLSIFCSTVSTPGVPARGAGIIRELGAAAVASVIVSSSVCVVQCTIIVIALLHIELDIFSKMEKDLVSFHRVIASLFLKTTDIAHSFYRLLYYGVAVTR